LATGCPSSSAAGSSRSGLIQPAPALLDDEQNRTVVSLLAFTGFRVSSVVTLTRDARELGPDGQPYLRYVNIEAKRQAMLPIAPALSEQLERQEALLAERYPEGTGWLLPSPPSGQRNGKGGAFHLLPVTIRKMVKRYISIAQIRGVDGELVLGVIRICFATTSRRAWSTRRFR